MYALAQAAGGEQPFRAVRRASCSCLAFATPAVSSQPVQGELGSVESLLLTLAVA